jgi:hypothetical protein
MQGRHTNGSINLIKINQITNTKSNNIELEFLACFINITSNYMDFRNHQLQCIKTHGFTKQKLTERGYSSEEGNITQE